MKKNRFLTLLLVSCFTLASITVNSRCTVYAEESDHTMTYISISSVEDWKELARNCIRDDYSYGKCFQLTKDIVFQNDFEPIPYMAGEFDGNGYSVSGVSFSGPASDYGMFRYVSENGIVKNLTVSIDLNVQGTSEKIGGIVSHNYGLIEQCVLEGSISGNDTVGGIAACNEESGVISDCRNLAEVVSLKYAGGIAGTNYGCILECENEGNTNHLSENASFESVGGIAGYNHGMISGCENSGYIGYRHIGYNVGGIAGLEDGLIRDCTNYGLVSGRKDTGGIAGQFTPFITVAYEELYLVTVINSMDHITSLSNELAKEMDAFGEMTMDSVKDVGESVGVQIADQTMDAVADTENLSELKDRLGEIDVDMNERKEQRENYSVNAQKSMDRIVSLTSQINREMSVIEKATNALDAKDTEDVIVDISATNQTDKAMGYILSCQNCGSIQSDSGAGGIVGTMDFDNTNNPEADIVQIGDLSLNLHATIQLVVEHCDNYGSVSAVNDHAAGIVGYAEYGYLLNNRNLADISSENGGYVAGIAAKCNAPIENCQTHCVLTGGSYVGGIAAIADQVTGCAAIVDIQGCKEKSGAILASFSEKCRNNYFVSDVLGGMDGISYKGCAEEIDISLMRELLALNPDFYDMKITFLAEGEVVDTLEVTYGGNISENQIPDVPANQEGLYGSWELFEKTNIEHGFVVRAIYDSWVTVIATNESVPLLLLEGKYYPDTMLEAEALPLKEFSMNNSKAVGHYKYKVISENIPKQESNTIRIYFERENDKRYLVALVDGNSSVIHLVEPETDGRYLVFDPQECEEFYILEEHRIYKTFIMCGIGLIIFLLILLPLTVGVVSKKKGDYEIEDSIRKHEVRKGRK